MTKLEDYLNLPTGTIETALKPLDTVVHSDNRLDDIKKDYEVTREAFHKLISRGEEMLEKLSGLIDESEYPAAFDYFGKMMMAIKDCSLNLMEIHKRYSMLIKEHEKEQAKKDENKVNKIEDNSKRSNDDAIFFGSAADLHRALEESNVSSVVRKK